MEKKCKHGMSNSPEYQAWADMKTRCYNSKNRRYKDYGGRGITVCDRWLNSFENFYEDMGARPSPDHSLERKENNNNYCPENCEWSIWENQYNNRRTCKYITYKNKTQTVTQWAKELEIGITTLRHRLYIMNMSVEEAFENDVREKVTYITFNGNTKSIKEWAYELGIGVETIRRRLNNNWSIEDALNKKGKR